MNKILATTIVCSVLLLSGCGTHENQQIIMSNLARSNAELQSERNFQDAMVAANGDPVAQVAIAVSYAHRSPAPAQEVETIRGYIGTIGSTLVRAIPFVGAIKGDSAESRKITAGRDVYIESGKSDSLVAGMGINESLTVGDSNSTASEYTHTEEEMMMSEESSGAPAMSAKSQAKLDAAAAAGGFNE